MVACTESPSATECEVIDVKQPEFANWASLLSIEEVVPLENTNSSLLTVASKCRVEGNLILFQDFKLKSLFVFDKHNGKFKYEVGKVGYSESEHVDFLDFQWIQSILLLRFLMSVVRLFLMRIMASF